MKNNMCLLVFGLTLGVTLSQGNNKFPDDFLFGVATASYQIEGGWNEDGKGENIWDHITHTHSEWVSDQSNGDISADSYHNYERDVEMLRELGLNAYRFSISWSRILPTGFSNEINEAGVQFYNNYINEMVKYNITPMVTLYHWDLPQPLQVLGGWTNPMIAEWFEDYARVIYEKFGDRVKKHWITFNEPTEICYQGYSDNTKAPAINSSGIGDYLCTKNLLLSHARAYHTYNNEFKAQRNGVSGITISINWFDGLTDSEDMYAAEIMRQADWGVYAEPIFSGEGGYPKEWSKRVAQKSAEQGYPRSRLPELSEEEKGYIRGSADFFGVNHYTEILVSASEYLEDHVVSSMYDDMSVGIFLPGDRPQAASSWLTLASRSLYYALVDLNQRYNKPTFYITENGWSAPPDSGLEDEDRITYYRAKLTDVLDVLNEGINLKGYMAWSLMDNFEWQMGYTERFGLYHVDFADPARPRTPRKSAFVYKHIVKHRYIDHEYEPDSLTMTIDEGH